MPYNIIGEDINEFFNIITNNFKEDLNELNEDNYSEFLFELICYYIDLHIDYYDYKEIVDKYGIFKAIEKYTKKYGNFKAEKNAYKNYSKLAFLITEEWFSDYYEKYTDLQKDYYQYVKSNEEEKLVLNDLSNLAIHCN